MHSKNTTSAARRGRTIWLALIASAGLSMVGCAESAGDRSEDDPNDGLAALERAAIHDADPLAREQAVLAYEQVAGEDAVPLLKDIALGDEAPEVRSAARAALHKIRVEHPRPPRAWVKVEHPARFSPGETFTVRLRFGSTESAPKARLGMRLPEGFVVNDAQAMSWRGAIEAGKENVMTFEVTAPVEPVKGSLQASFVVDYPEQLDLETVREKRAIEGDADGGTFAPMPPPRIITMSAAEVQP